LGVNFFDTADVYGSEPLLGMLRKRRHEPFVIATKMGRKTYPDVSSYNRRNLTRFVEDSLRELDTDTIDLMQLHCLPVEVYNAEVFGLLDDLVKQGKLRHYGVSVEKVSEAEKAMQFPNMRTVQIIFNMFRQKPADHFLAEAKQKGVGVIVRVPLASGLLTGKMTRDTKFSRDDHRAYNRHGEAFDRGETFSGVDFETGLAAVEELRPLVPANASMAQMALRWILMFDGVSCTIPGAKRPSQAEDNIAAASLPPLSPETMEQVKGIYDKYLRAKVHQLW
ncbi:aldo/keto reductase, partial [bacterium]